MNLFNRRCFLAILARLGATGAGVSALAFLNQGCGADLATTLGKISQHSDSITKVWAAGSKAMEDITPEQEYYIGRTLGAIVLSKYPPYTKRRPNYYMNVLGQTLAQFSDLPILFDAYHFLLLDSNDINAFATPSGLVFITRGMLKCCKNEDMFAAVLAHEIAHIQHRHGLQAIKQGRLTQALTTLAIEGTKTFGSQDLANLTDTFEDTIDDIVTTMMNNGYSRTAEYEADASTVTILKRTGYNPTGLIDMLQEMDKRLKPGSTDFASTHPTPESRIKSIASAIGPLKPADAEPQERKRRFQVGLKGV